MAALRGEVLNIPEPRYVRVGDYHVAYQVVGDGPIDLVFSRNVFNHLDMQWEQPGMAALLRRLASFSRLIVSDARGGGLSDPFQGDAPPLDSWSDDLVTVLDAVGSERPAIVCTGSAAPRAMLFAASHPDRVASLTIVDGAACMLNGDDYTAGVDVAAMNERNQRVERTWGTTVDMPDSLPAHLRTWWARYQRISISRGHAVMLNRYTPRLDVRSVLSAINVPTLVLVHTDAAPPFGVDAARYIAERIDGAKYVELPGRPYLWIFPDPEAVADEIQRFTTGTSDQAPPDRVLSTLLFTDIVDSTRATADAGDRQWRDILDTLDRVVAEEVGRFRGRVVKFTGDGHLATFDGPGRAISCGTSLGHRASSLGLTLRTGLHTGEVEVRGDDIGGIAVSIARRVCDAADDGSVFVSSAVPPLVAGSPIGFDDRGEHELKGVPGRWQLYAVRT